MPCAACGKPKLTTANTTATAVLVGEPDGFFRRVLTVEPFDGYPAGTVLYTTGDGVDALLDSGALVFA